MISRIHQKLGTAGFIISIVALAVALGGGAYAASGGLTGKQKKEVEKIAKKYAGKPGAPGATGPQGSAGSAGSKGDTGAEGKQGVQGGQGGQGNTGPAPTITESGSSFGTGHCDGTTGGVGGTKIVSGASTTYACNGKNGTTGFTETLPPGKTETGAWGITGKLESSFAVTSPITFAIPVSGTPVEALWLTKTETEEGPSRASACKGTIAAPSAPAGVLCVYTQKETTTGTVTPGLLFGLEGLAGPAWSASGAILQRSLSGATGTPASISSYGSYAITAPAS